MSAALEEVWSKSEAWLFDHASRSWLIAIHGRARGLTYDAEVLATGAVSHDLGLPTEHTGDHRFQVDGAFAARELIERAAPDMEPRRRQLFWNCIALHSTGSIARPKETKVVLINAGIWR